MRSVALLIILLISCIESSAQYRFHRGISLGTGHTFSRVDFRPAFNDFNHFAPLYSPTISFGVDLRWNIREQISVQTGLLALVRNYRLGYSRSESYAFPDVYDRLGVFFWSGGAKIPLLCITKFPLKEGLRITVPAGLSITIIGSFKEEVSVSEANGINGYSSLSASGDWAFESQLLGGFGIEKENKNNVITGLSLMLHAGLRKMMTGRYEFSDYSNPPATRYEYAEFFSRNTALMLNAYFLWPKIKNKKKLPDDKLYFEYRQLKRNFYIGLTTGTGHNFTRINWRDENNTLNNLKGRYGTSFLVGMDFRYDIKENLSIQTGVEYFNRSYRATYPKNFTDTAEYHSTIGFDQFRDNDLVVPLLCIGRVPINSRRLYASFTGGAAFNFMPNPDSYMASTNMRAFDLSVSDSVSGAFYAESNHRKSFQPMLVTGIGIEKKTERRGIVALSLVAYTGMQKIFTGDFYYYATPVPQQSIFDDFQLPAEQPAEHSKVLSRHVSIMLKFDFFFAVKRWKVPRE